MRMRQLRCKEREVAFNIKVPTYLLIRSGFLYGIRTDRWYPSTLAASTLIILFVEMLKFSNNIFFLKKQIFVKENRASFWNI